MLREIYRMCGIDFDRIPPEGNLDCNKVIVSGEKEEEIISKLEERYPDSELEIALVMMNYGPAVDYDQDRDVVVKQDLPLLDEGE